MHSYLYSLIGRLAVMCEGGKHPKHRLIKYHDWFISQIAPEWVVLDVGGGKGELAHAIAQNCKKVISVDIVRSNCDYAEAKNSRENIEYVCADMRTYMPEEHIDVVLLSNVLEHIDARVDFLMRLKGISKDFLIRVPTIERSWVDIYKKEMKMEWRLDKTHFIEYTQEQLQEELTAAGLKIEQIERRFDELFVCAKVCE